MKLCLERRRPWWPLVLVGACSFPQYAFEPPSVAPGACADGVQGPSETGIDCGGLCPACGAGLGCNSDTDCQSASCEQNICQGPSCVDGIANGAESDVDCGGRCAKLCKAGLRCNSETDCMSGVCENALCQAASCSDRVSNGDESGVDCGGACPVCPNGMTCRVAADCSSGACDPVQLVCVDPGCQDKTKNGKETDVDCGGDQCAPCAATQGCLIDADCDSSICDLTSKRCSAASCSDGVVNQGESDVDCGGAACPACPVDRNCQAATDCASGVCQAKLCVPSAATGIQLPAIGWTATALFTFDNSATSSMIDGDPNTRWTSGTNQAPGMWVVLDLSRTEIFFSVVIDCTNPAAQMPPTPSPGFSTDFGLGYDIYFSNDGTFGTAARSGVVGAPLTTISFDSAIVARYVKLELTSAGTHWWSIGELSVRQ